MLISFWVVKTMIVNERRTGLSAALHLAPAWETARYLEEWSEALPATAERGQAAGAARLAALVRSVMDSAAYVATLEQMADQVSG